jgi:hypothetical protein
MYDDRGHFTDFATASMGPSGPTSGRAATSQLFCRSSDSKTLKARIASFARRGLERPETLSACEIKQVCWALAMGGPTGQGRSQSKA